VLDGLAAGQSASGVDLGASEAPMEPTLARALTPEPVSEPEVSAPEAAALEAEMTGAAAEPDTTAAEATTAEDGVAAASE
jgi:small subunit ribosomal protein S2